MKPSLSMKSLFIAALALTIALASMPTPAHAGGAGDRIQQFINEILPILQDPAYDTTDHAAYMEQRGKLEVTIDDLFDWLMISQLTLSRAWNDFTPEQQDEFAQAFRFLLETTYMDRIQQSGTETLSILDETEVREGKFEVSTLAVISDPASELPITYRLYHHGTWKVYDVVVEGVSLVGNYRTQFQELLDSNTPEEFIDIVIQKAEEKRAQGGQ